MTKTQKQHKSLFFVVAISLFFTSCLSAQTRPAQRSNQRQTQRPAQRSTQRTQQRTAKAAETKKVPNSIRKHPGAIIACAQGQDANGASIFFFGDDAGFLSMHEVKAASKTEGEEGGGAGAGFSSIMEGIWQVSDLPIRMIAAHPAGKLVALYESDSFSTHRVSLWNWPEKKRLYAKRFQDSINAISWSAGGTYLMVANTSFNGITFLQGEGGKAVRPFKSSPGIVNLSATGKSERSVVNYAPAGRIVYTNLSSGETIEEYYTEPNLYSTSICNNNRTIVGFTEQAAFALNALDGAVIADIDATNPVAATTFTDAEPVWFERSGGSWVLRQGEHEPQRFRLAAGEEILAAAGGDQFRIFGTSAGDIYVFANGALGKEETASIASATGICAKGDFLFFIAEGSLYRVGKYGEAPELLLSSSKDEMQARFGSISSKIDSCAALNDESLLLWSSSTAAPLLRFNDVAGDVARLYTSQRGITSLSVSASGIALVEGNTRAVFIGDGEREPFAYSASGLQDAVMVSEHRMLVAKSADMQSPASLILVDVTTGETAPLNFTADICFALSPIERRHDLLCAYAITQDAKTNKKSTELILIKINEEQLSKSEIETVAVYSDEDLSAKLLPITSDRILAALGKTGLSEIRRRGGRQRMFERTYALPAKIAATEKDAVTLNYDGSISWYTTSGRATGNLALSLSGEWVWDGES